MTEKICLIKKTKRLRVRGVGPDRSQLKTFYKIGTASLKTVQILNQILDFKKGNDLGGDKYSISKHCDFEKIFNANENYRQILLQTSQLPNFDTLDEFEYNNWLDIEGIEHVQKDISRFIQKVFRARLSEMTADHVLEWHIDADPSVICRGQICLKSGGDTFEFKRRGVLESFTMDEGDIFFVNTGWSHRVVNGGSTRRVAIFGFSFNDVHDQKVLFV